VKRNYYYDLARKPGLQLITIRFDFNHPEAATVNVAGTFNDWNPGNKAMVPLGDGYWTKEAVLEPGIYEYCLVVDGKWMPDPRAEESVPNPFGGRNSILKIAPTSRVALLTDRVVLPVEISLALPKRTPGFSRSNLKVVDKNEPKKYEQRNKQYQK